MASYLVDANLPQTFNLWRTSEFAYVRELGLEQNDTSIWNYALQNNLVILPKDKDFVDRIIQTDDELPKVIHFQVGNMRFAEFRTYMLQEWERIKFFSHNFKLVYVHSDSIEGVR